MEDCYLGFDFSTQQLKAVVINDKLKVTHQATVKYDIDLPEFRTHGGVHKHDDEVTVTAPPSMWIKALDLILDLLRLQDLDFSTVVAISGAAQQHGSVYWKRGAEEILDDIAGNNFLYDQLQGCFSVRDSPVWMDESTSLECALLERATSGPLPLARVTGSRAFERFTGNQIAKLFRMKPDAYNNTERISLVSSFGATLFLGRYAPIDISDGSGMNLLDIHSKDWSDFCLNMCAPNLREKLGTPVPSCTVLGTIATYYCERFGFSDTCKIVAFTGDNPASLAGTQLNKGEMAISLGTSDTLFLWLANPKPSLNGHILCNPLDSKEYMALLCFKNGSLTRERIRDECAEGSWQLFNDLLESTPRGNFGNIGMYFDSAEIVPPQVKGDYRFNKNNELIERFSKEVEVRALVEGQFLARRVHAEDFGFSIHSASRIIATGGASTNKSLIQVLADVFNMPVYVLEFANSACLGAALRAKHGLLGDFPFQNMFVEPLGLHLSCSPAKDAAQVYGPMLTRFRMIQGKLQKRHAPFGFDEI
ncbi:xylulose kinase-like [Stegodyphus dumicola]|uniref:xylulose kinase-like n=1 Tax=Stegodyphus dumicola TaxID=202533 RepID=UPI0015B1EB57|nr:xylulose kinase-like [Stegodyphus dumicola]